MLIKFYDVKEYLHRRRITINGILHIGAHECEELLDYTNDGIPPKSIDWIEANPKLVQRMAECNIYVHNYAISDSEEVVPFYITNDSQSSSLLPIGTHEKYYPNCKVIDTFNVKTYTLEHIIESQKIPIQQRNFWCINIQGAELKALKSAGDFINSADAIYCKVNIEETYIGASLLKEVDEFLKSNKFKRDLISITQYGWGDALYVRVKE